MNPGRRLLFAVALLAFATCVWNPARAFAQDSPTLRPIGVRVVAPAHGDDDTLRAFSQFEGTSVSLLLLYPQGGLLSIDNEGSKLTAFTDDKGTNLAVKKGFSSPGFGGFPRINEKATAAVIEVSGGGIPKAGATTLKIEGTLLLRTASKQETQTAKDVKVQADTKIKVGPMTWTIAKAGKPQWGDDPLMIEFSTNQKLDALAGIRFLDSKGKEIESNRAGSSSMTFMGKTEVTVSYTLARKVDVVTIESTWWTDMKETKLPVKLEAGLGL